MVQSTVSSTGLRASAQTFSVQPVIGDASHGRTGAAIQRVVGDLKSTVVLLTDGKSRLCLVTSSANMETAEMRAAIETAVAETIGFKPTEIITVCSHNHCTPIFVENPTVGWARLPGAPVAGTLNRMGLEFIANLRAALKDLPGRLEPVTLEWGKAEEKRFTYNRRGRRPDGTSYFIREEDRQLLPPDYTGLIDPEATVVVFRGAKGAPVAALAHYTGHPLTAYHPERMTSWGEFPQVATEILSARLGGAPVAFLQGCCGDINAKFLLTGTVEQSRQFGEWLGEAFVKALGSLQPSRRDGLQVRQVMVELPLAELPPEADLVRDLAEIDDFIRRGEAGDDNTLACVGMNFPRVLSPRYRAKLVEMIRPWFPWAIATRREGRTGEVPKTFPVEIVVARIGDVGLVGLPFEPYVKTGLKIKREGPLPCMLPCGYTGNEYGYVPDATACDDREYMSGFFRYTRFRPPYRAPAGDEAAAVAVQTLKTL